MDPITKSIPQCPARVTIPAWQTVVFTDAQGNIHGKFEVPQPIETKVVLEWPNEETRLVADANGDLVETAVALAPFTATFTDKTPAPAQDSTTVPPGCIDV